MSNAIMSYSSFIAHTGGKQSSRGVGGWVSFFQGPHKSEVKISRGKKKTKFSQENSRGFDFSQKISALKKFVHLHFMF